MLTELPIEFIKNVYFKALNQRLRQQDLEGVTKIINTVFDEFITINQNTNIEKYFEKMKTQEPQESVISEQGNKNHDIFFKDARGYCWSCSKIRYIQELKNKLEKYEQKS